MALSAEQINEHIDKFIPIWVNGKEVNPVPNNFKVTVWCSNGKDEQGFACNVKSDEMGLTALIAVSWIKESELKKLCKRSLV